MFLATPTAIPENLLEGDVIYLAPDRVRAQTRAAPGSNFHWPPDLAIPVLAERVEVLRRVGRIEQTDLYYAMLRALLLHPNAESAEKYRRILLDWQPELEQILRTSGVTLAGQGRPDRGARYLRLATIVSPDRPEARHDLGVCLEQQAQQSLDNGDYEMSARLHQESARHLEEARQMSPEMERRALAEIETDMERAAEALRGGQAKEARDGFARVVNRQPMRWPAWFLLGVAQRMLGDFRQAALALEKAVALAPDEPAPRNELGLVRYFRREYGAAEEHLRCAVRLNPQSAGYLCNLALVLLHTNRLPEAETLLERAAALDPADRIIPRCCLEARRFANPLYRLLRRVRPLRDSGWQYPPSAQG